MLDTFVLDSMVIRLEVGRENSRDGGRRIPFCLIPFECTEKYSLYIFRSYELEIERLGIIRRKERLCISIISSKIFHFRDISSRFRHPEQGKKRPKVSLVLGKTYSFPI